MKVYWSSIVNIYDDGEGHVSFSLQGSESFRHADVHNALMAMKQEGYWEAFEQQFPIQAKIFTAIEDNSEHCDIWRLTYDPWR